MQKMKLSLLLSVLALSLMVLPGCEKGASEKCSRRREEADKRAASSGNPPPHGGGYKRPRISAKTSRVQQRNFAHSGRWSEM